MDHPGDNGNIALPSPEKRRRRRMRALRRRRIRRGGRRAYVRSVQFLPSLATLGNALCGFAAIYVATLDRDAFGTLLVNERWVDYRYLIAAYLIALAMVFDALDGRLARFARHTSDFGGQLDSLADAVSFGAAPALIVLHVFKFDGLVVPPFVSRLIWAAGALYVACALVRLARFNVSNEHGEESHQSFLGLPSPGAAGAVLGLVLIQQDLLLASRDADPGRWTDALGWLAVAATVALPIVLAATAVLMVAGLRYPHLVNRTARGNKSIARLIGAVVLVLVLVVAHRYTLGLAGLLFAFLGPAAWLARRARRSR